MVGYIYLQIMKKYKVIMKILEKIFIKPGKLKLLIQIVLNNSVQLIHISIKLKKI